MQRSFQAARYTMFLLVALAVLPLSGCKSSMTGANAGGDRSALLAALPGDHTVGDWKREGRAYRARGLEELSKQINGGAPFYIERGVEESVFQEYSRQGGAVWVNVVLHKTGTSRQAANLYRELHAEGPEPMSGLGREARSLPNLIGVYAVEFRKGPTYATLTITDTSKESRKDLHAFAKYIAKRLPRR